jgi:hypothetical protein
MVKSCSFPFFYSGLRPVDEDGTPCLSSSTWWNCSSESREVFLLDIWYKLFFFLEGGLSEKSASLNPLVWFIITKGSYPIRAGRTVTHNWVHLSAIPEISILNFVVPSRLMRSPIEVRNSLQLESWGFKHMVQKQSDSIPSGPIILRYCCFWWEGLPFISALD